MPNPFSARYLRPGVLPYLFPDGVTLSMVDDALWAAGGRGQIVGPHGTGKSTLLAEWCQRMEEQGVVVKRLKFQSSSDTQNAQHFTERLKALFRRSDMRPCHPPFCEARTNSRRVASRRAGRGGGLSRSLDLMRAVSSALPPFASPKVAIPALSLAKARPLPESSLEARKGEVTKGGTKTSTAERKNGTSSLPSPRRRPRPFGFPLVPRSSEGDSTILVIDGYEQLRWWQRRLVETWCSWNRVGLLVTTHVDVGLNTVWKTPSNSRLAHSIATRLADEAGVEIPFAVVDRQWRACRGDIRETLFALYDWIETDVAVIATPAKSA